MCLTRLPGLARLRLTRLARLRLTRLRLARLRLTRLTRLWLARLRLTRLTRLWLTRLRLADPRRVRRVGVASLLGETHSTGDCQREAHRRRERQRSQPPPALPGQRPAVLPRGATTPASPCCDLKMGDNDPE